MADGGLDRGALVLGIALVASGCLGLSGSGPGFESVGDAAGLTYVVDGTLPKHVFPMVRMGGGLAVGDVDGDGWPDIYVADAGPNALYLNNGDGTFRDATEAWDAFDEGMGRAPALFDVDNDGDLDLFVGNYGDRSRLLENTGQGFRDITASSGVSVETQVTNAAVADVNGDNLLDLFLGVYTDSPGEAHETWTTSENGARNLLFINQGDGTFVESARELGLTTTRWTLASAFSDVDRDGDPDLYVANDFGWDSLFINEGGRFVEQAHQRGLMVNTNGMGATWFDADGDADLDLYVTAIHVPGSSVPAFHGNDLFLNTDARFERVTEAAGVADGGWSWHAEALDVENDGDEDLYVANGFHSRGPWDVFYDAGMAVAYQAPRDVLMKGDYNGTHEYYFLAVPGNGVEPPENPQNPARVTQGGYQHNRLLVNDGLGTFTERAASLGVDLLGDSRAAASLDFDQDGDLDLVVTAAQEPVHLLENRVADASGNHWLQITLDPGPGRPAIPAGAYIEVTTPERVHVRELWGPSGFMTQSEAIAHVGLGSTAQVQAVTVHWPWGQTTTVEDVDVDQRVTVAPSGLR